MVWISELTHPVGCCRPVATGPAGLPSVGHTGAASTGIGNGGTRSRRRACCAATRHGDRGSLPAPIPGA